PRARIAVVPVVDAVAALVDDGRRDEERLRSDVREHASHVGTTRCLRARSEEIESVCRWTRGDEQRGRGENPSTEHRSCPPCCCGGRPRPGPSLVASLPGNTPWAFNPTEQCSLTPSCCSRPSRLFAATATLACRSKPSMWAWRLPVVVTQGAPDTRPSCSTRAPARGPRALQPWTAALVMPARARDVAARGSGASSSA